VAPAEPIELAGPGPRYVSRGGAKLQGALDEFAFDVRDKRCLDVGSSTGGFTDCLLQRGASSVVALDVGRGQLDWSLRNDPRVVSIERTDVRDVEGSAIGSVDFVTVDVSFISLRTVLPAIRTLAGDAPILALVKPQFEVGRARVGKGGVVRDAALQAEAVESVVTAAQRVGLRKVASTPSAITGARGNQEYFVLLEPSS
jgi:23S rRNA (cytidine1920-2'-O)/16S rRNA (cytidine1409-2'-O)-methyltransferase